MTKSAANCQRGDRQRPGVASRIVWRHPTNSNGIDMSYNQIASISFRL